MIKKKFREGFMDNSFNNNSIKADVHDVLGHDNDIDVPVLSKGTNNESAVDEAWDTLWDDEVNEGFLDGAVSGNSVNVNVGKLVETEEFDDFDTQIQSDELIPAGYEDDYDWNWEDFECEDPTDRNCPIVEKCEKLEEGDAKDEISVCPTCGAIKYKGHPTHPKAKGKDINEAAAKDEVSVCPTCGKIRYKKHQSCCEAIDIDSKINQFVDSITEEADFNSTSLSRNAVLDREMVSDIDNRAAAKKKKEDAEAQIRRAVKLNLGCVLFENQATFDLLSNDIKRLAPVYTSSELADPRKGSEVLRGKLSCFVVADGKTPIDPYFRAHCYLIIGQNALTEAKKKEDKPENIKDCLMAALDEIEVPEDEELDPKEVLDAIADCLDDEAREYLCDILCPKDEEEKFELPEDDEEVEEGLIPTPAQTLSKAIK